MFGHDLGCCVSSLISCDGVVCLDFHNGCMDSLDACLMAMVLWTCMKSKCFMGMFCIWIELELYVAMF